MAAPAEAISASRPSEASPSSSASYHELLLSKLADRLAVKDFGPSRGRGLEAQRDIKAGEVIWAEEPIVSHQFSSNASVVDSCHHCQRFIGSLQSQLNKLATVSVPEHWSAGIDGEDVAEEQEQLDSALPPLPDKLSLPRMDDEATRLTAVVECPLGCEARFCSAACAEKALRRYHLLLCTGLSGASASSKAKVMKAMERLSKEHDHGKEGEEKGEKSKCCDGDHAHGHHHHHHDHDHAGAHAHDGDHEHEEEEGELNAAVLFRQQSLQTTEMFIFAAKAIGRVLEAWCRNGHNLEAAMAPFVALHSAPLWRVRALRDLANQQVQALNASAEGEEEDDEEEGAEEGGKKKGEAAAGGAGGAGDDDEDDDTPAVVPLKALMARVEAFEAGGKDERFASIKAEAEEELSDNLTILRALVKERLPLIASVVTPAAGSSSGSSSSAAAALQEWEEDTLLSPVFYERLLSACELNCIEVRIDSPLREYFEVLLSLPKTAASGKAAGGKAGSGGKKGKSSSGGAGVSPYDETMAALLPVVEQVRAARLARRKLRAKLEKLKYMQHGGGEEDEKDEAEGDKEEEEEEDDDDDEDDEDGAWEHESDFDTDEEPDTDEEEETSNDPYGMSMYEVRRLFPLSKGSALFAIVSNLNHSCTPHVQLAFAEGDSSACVLSIAKVPKGEEVCLNYIDIEQPRRYRQVDLLQYGFICDCSRCKAEEKEEAEEEAGEGEGKK